MNLHLDGIALRAGSRTLIDGLTHDIGAGEMWCIAGPNGAGKTTLIDVLAGLSKPARSTTGAATNSPACAC